MSHYSHYKELLHQLDVQLSALLTRQLSEASDERMGGFWTDSFHVEPRQSGFFLSEMLAAYVTKESCYYLQPAMAQAIQRTLTYMERHQRPDGCFDLTPCNYASPPDTAFMINAVLNGWWLLEKCTAAEADFIRKPLYQLIDSASKGIAAGGFHTPNHRWAISSCLLCCEKITKNSVLGDRARQFLREGLDVNEDGEFAERSAGNYNQVNDDQMIRLFIATGDEIYLRAAEKNLEMMYCYFDPDDSVFTNNSTRQDLGKKVYADTYYSLYLLVGWLLKREDFGAMAQWIWDNCRRRGCYPPGVEWLLLYPEMDGYGEGYPFHEPFLHYNRLFPSSDIARIRNGAWSCSLLKGKANCIYFQHGAFSMYMTIYSNLCDRRNFLADTLEKTENGYTMKAHAAGWYYLPFPEKPETSDWWAMDNPNRRPKIEGLPLDTTLTVRLMDDGLELRIHTEGIDQLPLRLEFSFLPGGYVRTEHFLQHTKAGESINVLDGELEAQGASGETILIGPAFGAHDVTDRMGGAYPLSQSHYTAYFTAYTPVDQVLRIRAARKDRHLVSP
ncbi:MAG: hypothetical protein PHI98_06405 [Eubacteriales bacterium]|nr:hypothetical protein [Eubacteriales bacterium]